MGTVVELFASARSQWHDHPALRTRTSTGWIARSWHDWYDTASAVSLALADLGVRPGDRVALLARARREGAEMALGAALAGATLVTLPSRVDDDTLCGLVQSSGSSVLVVDDPASLGRVLVASSASRVLRPEARGLRRVIALDTRATLRARDPRGRMEVRLEDVVPLSESSRVMRWPELLSAGRALASRAAPDPVAGVRSPRDEFAMVYTAGRGGGVREVTLTHEKMVAAVDALAAHIPMSYGDEQLAVAPLSSVFGLSQLVGAIRAGVSTAFADPGARPEAQIAEVHPTVLAAPPQFYERMRDAALAAVTHTGDLRRAVIDHSLDVGHRVGALVREGREPGPLLRAQHRAARLVCLDALKLRMGTRLRFALSAGAPLARGVAEWFHACGVLLLEGYGLAETAGVTHLNTPDAYRFGTAGRALPGVVARTTPARELVLSGPMLDGELHTGDLATIDAEGFLHLHGRA